MAAAPSLMKPDDYGPNAKIPTGIRFLPTDEELVYYYLQRKVNQALPICDINPIKTLNHLYTNDPWKIFDGKIPGFFYVFTKLKHKSQQKFDRTTPSGQQKFDRTTPSGTWKGQSNKTYSDYCKRTFRFEEKGKEKKEKNKNGEWVMTEFSLGERALDVLCKIWNKDVTGSHGVKRKHSLEEEDGKENSKKMCIIKPENHNIQNSSNHLILDQASALNVVIEQEQLPGLAVFSPSSCCQSNYLDSKEQSSALALNLVAEQEQLPGLDFSTSFCCQSDNMDSAPLFEKDYDSNWLNTLFPSEGAIQEDLAAICFPHHLGP